MTWLRLEDNMLDHPKWRRAISFGGDEVLAVWFRLVSWSSRNLTDGHIPGDMVAEVARVRAGTKRSKSLRALEEALLITRGEGEDITIVDYLQRNPSASQVRAERERKNKAQRTRRLSGNEAGLHSGAEAGPCSVPSHPIPSHPNPIRERSAREAEAANDSEPPSKTEIRSVPAVSRVYSLPTEDPPRAYLDEAVMGGVSPEQARETWKYYFGAGLPERGVERLHKWLVQRAKERANQVARLPTPSPKPSRGRDPIVALAEVGDRDAIAELERRKQRAGGGRS